MLGPNISSTSGECIMFSGQEVNRQWTGECLHAAIRDDIYHQRRAEIKRLLWDSGALCLIVRQVAAHSWIHFGPKSQTLEQFLANVCPWCRLYHYTSDGHFMLSTAAVDGFLVTYTTKHAH